MNIKLEVRNIKKKYDDMPIIDNVTLSLGEGEFVSLLGLSGSGKSTIFNIIAGLLDPDSGEVYIDNENWTGRTGRVSYMYQKDLLMPWRKVIDNAALPLMIQGMSRKNAREKVQQYFRIFGLEGFEYKYPFQLSGGMRQRAALLRTYMFSRDIMLLDEPFGGLDAITRTNMFCWLQEVLSELKTSVLFITHDIDEAVFLSDRIYMLSERPSRIKAEIFVDIQRPREKNIVTDSHFNELKREVLSLLNAIISNI